MAVRNIKKDRKGNEKESMKIKSNLLPLWKWNKNQIFHRFENENEMKIKSFTAMKIKMTISIRKKTEKSVKERNIDSGQIRKNSERVVYISCRFWPMQGESDPIKKYVLYAPKCIKMHKSAGKDEKKLHRIISKKFSYSFMPWKRN